MILLSAINTGDMLAQIIMFIFLLAIPAIIVVLLIMFKKKSDRLKRVEDKLDQLMSEQKN